MGRRLQFSYWALQRRQRTVSVSGVRSGRSVRWHANGRKAEEGEFVNGKKNGLWVEYFETGAERDRKTWRRGVRSW